MQIEQFVPWDDDMEEIVFASHTSIIWQDLLLDQIEANGVSFVRPEKAQSHSRTIQVNDNTSDRIKKMLGFKSIKLKYVLDSGSLQNDDNTLKRVKIEALDFDWVFQGDNAK